MKHKSFLFLIAALALGLALLGCSTDSDSSTEYVKQGYANDALAITLAFEKAPDVYVLGTVNLTNAFLTIPTGKRLHLSGNTVLLDDTTTLVVNGTVVFEDGKVDAQGKKPIVVGLEPGPNFVGTENLKAFSAGGFMEDEGKYYQVVNKASDLLDNGSIKGALAGTTVIYAGNLDMNSGALNTNGGTLSVGGDLTNVSKIITSTKVTVSGKLTGGAGDPPAPNILAQVLGNIVVRTDTNFVNFMTGAGTVTASIAEIDSGSIGVPLFEAYNGKFGGSKKGQIAFGGTLLTVDSEFNGPVKFTPAPISPAGATELFTIKFNDDVEFEQDAEITRVSIADGKTLTGKLIAATFETPGASGFILDQGGEVIINGESDFSDTGTFSAIGTGTLSLALKQNSITVGGGGTLDLGGADIKLTGGNTFVFNNAGGVFLNEEHTITGYDATKKTGYQFGGPAGTLRSGDKITLSADGITGVSGTSTITFGVAAEGGTFLTIFQGSTAIITNANIDISTVGTISVGEAKNSAIIILNNGGSITTGGEGSPAWGGTIGGTAAAGGSLLVGSVGVGGANTSAGIIAGSVGTSSADPVGAILTGAGFMQVTASLANGLTGAGINGAQTTDGGSASLGGSILVFTTTAP
jgi:hypothetical protein